MPRFSRDDFEDNMLTNEAVNDMEEHTNKIKAVHTTINITNITNAKAVPDQKIGREKNKPPQISLQDSASPRDKAKTLFKKTEKDHKLHKLHKIL